MLDGRWSQRERRVAYIGERSREGKPGQRKKKTSQEALDFNYSTVGDGD